jgi:hypothetical protein
MSDNSASIESLKDSKLTPYQRWEEEIKQAELELKDFHNRGRKVNRRFLDERDMLDSSNKWFNIYYANTNIMESALYAQLPKPSVSRRFKDYDDDVARVAGTIIQRSITQDLDDPRDAFDSTMRSCVQDRLIPGLAAAWLRLETDTEDVPYQEAMGDTFHPGDATDKPPEPLKKITDQRVCIDYVYWQDFIWSPCRTWEERRWVGRKAYMSRDALIKRFGEKIGKQVSLDFNPTLPPNHGSTPGTTPKHMAIKQAVVYEIWDRERREVIWFSKGYKEILDTKADPLKLVGFEPCPRPMFANITTSNTVPRPDYYMIQDQYQELDTINNRVSMLLQACKVVGVYDQSASGISRMLTEGFDNQLIPVDNWAMFAEKGGLKGQVDWLPLDVVVDALTQLITNRDLIKAQIYELTGISDIVRGASKASETLGAQEIKSKFASIAIKKRQDEVARFAGDLLRLKAEIQVKHFDDEFLLKNSNIVATGADNVKLIEPALALLHSDSGFEWRIQVTADSIAQADYAMEKADRIEFLTAVSGYLEKASAMFQAVPGSASFLVGMLKWAVAGFRNASEIEGMLDKELDAISKQPPPEPPPNPEEQKMQLEKQKTEAKMAADEKKSQLDQQSKQQDMAMQERMNQMEMRMKEMELQYKVKELELKEREANMNLDFKAAEAAQNQKTQLMESQMSLDTQAQEHAMSLEQQEESHAMESEQAQEDHKLAMDQTKETGKIKAQAMKEQAKAKPKPTGGKK